MQGHTTEHFCPYATRSARGMLQYIATKAPRHEEELSGCWMLH